MMRQFCLTAGLIAQALMAVPAATAAPAPARLTDQHRHDLRCAAAFAVVAVAQADHDARALALPPLGIRGRRYLGLIGARVAGESGLTAAAVRDLLTAEARSVAHDGAPAIAASCLPALDAVVPPRPVPTRVTCAAILGVYAEVLTQRDAASPLAATFRGEAAAVGSRIDAAVLDRARAAIRASLRGGPDAPDADDLARCRAMARG